MLTCPHFLSLGCSCSDFCFSLGEGRGVGEWESVGAHRDAQNTGRTCSWLVAVEPRACSTRILVELLVSCCFCPRGSAKDVCVRRREGEIPGRLACGGATTTLRVVTSFNAVMCDGIFRMWAAGMLACSHLRTERCAVSGMGLAACSILRALKLLLFWSLRVPLVSSGTWTRFCFAGDKLQ